MDITTADTTITDVRERLGGALHESLTGRPGGWDALTVREREETLAHVDAVLSVLASQPVRDAMVKAGAHVLWGELIPWGHLDTSSQEAVMARSVIAAAFSTLNA